MNTPTEQQLRQFFATVDKDRSNAINCQELQSALSNGTFTPFNIETVRLMVAMFDTRRTGTVDFDQFCRLWRYITDWLNCFRSFDADNSGHIDRTELSRALTTFGYRFSDQFYETLMQKFEQRVKFDDFLQICIHLQTLTEEFRRRDSDLDGVVTLSYEEFVSLVLKTVVK